MNDKTACTLLALVAEYVKDEKHNDVSALRLSRIIRDLGYTVEFTDKGPVIDKIPLDWSK